MSLCLAALWLLCAAEEPQAPRMRELCGRLGLVARFQRDLAGHERVMELSRPWS